MMTPTLTNLVEWAELSGITPPSPLAMSVAPEFMASMREEYLDFELLSTIYINFMGEIVFTYDTATKAVNLIISNDGYVVGAHEYDKLLNRHMAKRFVRNSLMGL